MKLPMLLLAASIGLVGCEVNHIHHFSKEDLVECDCDRSRAMSSGGQHLPMSYGENVKVLPPIYQPVAANAYPPAYHQPVQPVYQAPAPAPAPQVNIPEYYRLTPVDPGHMPQNGQAQPNAMHGQPMGYSTHHHHYQPQPAQQPQQPVMPIPMSSNSSKNSESNIKTYLFQPAGGVVYQY